MNPKLDRPLWKNRWLKFSYGALTGMAIVLILGILLLSTSQNV
ncbi:hypothetical protein [Leptolyngbya sp. FACHB-711]|jgi:hypothetical protein|nr:hypothetical protein [Leptolyngbya sp. FACHB-711]